MVINLVMLLACFLTDCWIYLLLIVDDDRICFFFLGVDHGVELKLRSKVGRVETKGDGFGWAF
jgi:hypothetical protein